MSKFLLHVACAIALSGSSAAAWAQEKVKIRLSFATYGFHTGIYYAKERGWFKEQGLEVEIEDGTGSTATVSLVGAGNFDIGEAALSVMAQGRVKGLPVKSIAGFIPNSDVGVLVPRDGTIRSLKDLAGKKVIYSASSLEAPFLDVFFQRGGISRDKMELINIDGMAKVSAYAVGRADALVTVVPAIMVAVEKQRPSNAILFMDHGLTIPSVGYFATEKTIAERPKAMKGFVAAMSRAISAIRDEGKIDEAVAAVLKNRPQQRFGAESLKAQMIANFPFMESPRTKDRPYGWQSREDWIDTLNIMREVGLLDRQHAPEEFFTNDFVPAGK